MRVVCALFLLTAGCAPRGQSAGDLAAVDAGTELPPDDMDARELPDAAAPGGDVAHNEDGADAGAADPFTQEQLVAIPAGTFRMGDHHGQGGQDPNHPSDELPLHDVSLQAFALGKYEVTNDAYAAFLNDAAGAGQIDLADGAVYGHLDGQLYAGIGGGERYSRILWDGARFTVQAHRGQHPVIDVRWAGAVAYANWLSGKYGFAPVCDVATGACTWTAHGFRLPTEAEWEYAARGGQHAPYRMFPWGDDVNADGTLANWEASGDPFEAGPLPWTTPVGFYSGALHAQADFQWPAPVATYQTRNGCNAYGLCDMSGNVWEWVHDWYDAAYYAHSPAADPPGPATGQPMPDGAPWRAMRGGNWYNGKDFYGHGRVSNRNPSYFKGPQDPNHPWYHVGFRVLLR